MDQDGANMRYLTGPGLVLGPRFSPNDRTILYTSYDTGQPEMFVLDIASGQAERLGAFPGMTLAPHLSPSGNAVEFSVTQNGDPGIKVMDLATRHQRAL